MRAKAAQDAAEKRVKYGRLYVGKGAAARSAVRANKATTLFSPLPEEQEAAAGRLSATMARSAIHAGATMIGVSAETYARAGVDRLATPRVEGNRVSVDHAGLGRQRFEDYHTSSGGVNPSRSMPPPPVRAPLSPSSANAGDDQTRRAPRAKEKARGRAAQDGSVRVSTTPGRLASVLAHDPFSLQSSLEQTQAMAQRNARDSGLLPPSFTGSQVRVVAGAGVVASEPARETGASGGAVQSLSDHIATLTGEQREQALSLLTDVQIGNEEGLARHVEEIKDVRERRRVQRMEEEDRQRVQEAPTVSLGDAAAAQVLRNHEAPPLHTPTPSPSNHDALVSILLKACPHVPKDSVSVVLSVLLVKGSLCCFLTGYDDIGRGQRRYAARVPDHESVPRGISREAHAKCGRQSRRPAGRRDHLPATLHAFFFPQVSSVNAPHSPTSNRRFIRR